VIFGLSREVDGSVRDREREGEQDQDPVYLHGE